MKLIITGGTGYLASELISQALAHPSITSLIVLSRTPITIPSSSFPSSPSSPSSTKPTSSSPSPTPAKLTNLLLKSYSIYSNEIKKEFSTADACIWTVAITISKSRGMDFEDVKRVCQTDTMAGMKVMSSARDGKKRSLLNFIYLSGWATSRDLNAKPWLMPEYSLMRSETELLLLDFAAANRETISVCIAKPGLITAPTIGGRVTSLLFGTLSKLTGEATIPVVRKDECAAALLDRAVRGWEREPLENEQLVRLGRAALQSV